MTLRTSALALYIPASEYATSFWNMFKYVKNLDVLVDEATAHSD